MGRFKNFATSIFQNLLWDSIKGGWNLLSQEWRAAVISSILSILAGTGAWVGGAPLWVWYMSAPIGTLVLSLLILTFYQKKKAQQSFAAPAKETDNAPASGSPGANVIIREHLGCWFLDVSNTGDCPATFQGQINIIDVEHGHTQRDHYTAVWSDGKLTRDTWSVGTEQMDILPGLVKSIAVAEMDIHQHIVLFTPTLFAYSQISYDHGMQRINAGSWSPGSGALKPRIVFEVTISSNPPLRNGPRTERFELGVRGLRIQPPLSIRFNLDRHYRERPEEIERQILGLKKTNRIVHFAFVKNETAQTIRNVSVQVIKFDPSYRFLDHQLPYNLRTHESHNTQLDLPPGREERFEIVLLAPQMSSAPLLLYGNGEQHPFVDIGTMIESLVEEGEYSRFALTGSAMVCRATGDNVRFDEARIMFAVENNEIVLVET